LGDNLSEQVHVGLAIAGTAQLSDLLEKAIGPLIGIRLVGLAVLVLRVEPQLLEQTRLDLLVVQEGGEGVELLAQELVYKVNRGVDDTSAVRLHRVGHVSGADYVQVFAPAVRLHEQLQVHIVGIRGGERVYIAHDLQHIYALKYEVSLDRSMVRIGDGK